MFMSMSSFFSICSYDYLKRCAFRCSQDHRTIILKHKLTTEAATPPNFHIILFSPPFLGIQSFLRLDTCHHIFNTVINSTTCQLSHLIN